MSGRITLSCFAVLLACGTSSPVATGGPTSAPAVAEAEAPPHLFTARAHPPHEFPPPPAPDLASLPRLVDRSAQCAGRVAEPKAPPPPRSTGRRTKTTKKKKKSSTHVPYNPGGGGGGSGAVGGSGAKGGGSVPSSSPPPPAAEPTPAPKSAAAEKRKDSNRERARKKAPRADPEPAAEAPAMDFAEAEDDLAGAPVDAEIAAADLQVAERDADEGYDDWGQSIYLSNDDTMSLSSAQRVLYAIDKGLPIPLEHIRPHELLNYFSFDMAPVEPANDFSVRASLAPVADQPGIYSLALGVRGRPMGVDDRRNANLAFVIDRSGSMRDEGRMEYLKRGLMRSVDQLKRGDIVHLVLFDNKVCTSLENFVVGRDPTQLLTDAIAAIEPRGATDLERGLAEGYAVADRAHQMAYTNRVVMITDAITNTGVTDPELIATVSKFYDRRRIRLSGVGVGTDFNDELLDRLTERGRGAYVFLGSEAEVDAVFGPRFVSLIETTALDVHFRLHLPPSLRMNMFYGEESSTVKEEVQPIHYFANTSQLFLQDLMARGGKLREQDTAMLTIEYDDPESGDARVEEFVFNLGEAMADARNVAKARLVIHFIDGLAWMEGSRGDSRAGELCHTGRPVLQRLSEPVSDDPEVRRILSLWDRYCTRHPARRDAADDTWPGAAR